MLQYMLDTNICIYVIKNRPVGLREQFNRLAEQICNRRSRSLSCITASRNRLAALKTFRRSSNSLPGSKRCHSLPRQRLIMAR